MTDRVRRLLVDARPIEHPTARRRGIGRYTTGILQGFAEVGTPVTALASNAAEAALIRPQVPGVDVQVWDPAVVRAHVDDDTWYLATGLFLHPVSFDPIPSVITRAGLPVAGIMYDVIPYRYPDRYLVDPPARRLADLRKPLARTVDAVLAISRFAATTSVEELDLDPVRVRTIGAGVESRFERADRTLPRPTDVPEDRYVVCVTGADEHKNTLGLIEAWGRARVSHQLVIVGGASEAVRGDWRRATEQASVADRVDITGAVSDERLVRLLQYASLSITPSFEEGFGLPVLEAAACGCAVITSDRGALPEVLDEPASCFDPADPAAIAEAIELAVIDDHHREILLAAGRRAVARWTWPYVAINALDAIDAAAIHRAGRQARPAVLLVYDAAMADTGAAVAAAIGALPGAPVVWEAVDVAGGVETSHPAALRSPAGAVGHFPKVHDFDRVVVLGEAAVPAAVPAAVRLLAPFDAHQIAALLPTV